MWQLVTKTVPEQVEAKKIIEQLQERTKYLNDLRLKNLRFQAKNGTNFKVSLTPASRWINSFHDNRNGVAMNFPSYEICTCPDKFSTNGKIVMTKQSFLGGFSACKGEFIFRKGKIMRCQTDNQEWSRAIKNPENHLNYLGEIALVPTDTPIASLNQTFFETQTDENTGCHIALGNNIPECIDYSKTPIGAKNYNFNHSLWHYDLPIGDESMRVEATSYTGKKRARILIMENGKWKI